jgi:hypothetical protein
MTLAEGKVAFEKIIKDRHQRLGTDPTAHLERIKTAHSALTMWQQAHQILAGLNAGAGPMGCCTYTIGDQTSMIDMTETECNGVPDPNRHWNPSPCPPQ